MARNLNHRLLYSQYKRQRQEAELENYESDGSASSDVALLDTDSFVRDKSMADVLRFSAE